MMKKITLTFLAIALAASTGCGGGGYSNSPVTFDIVTETRAPQTVYEDTTEQTLPATEVDPDTEPAETVPPVEIELVDFTPEDIRANNSALKILSEHTSFDYHTELTDGSGELIMTSDGKYINIDGKITLNIVNTYADGQVEYTEGTRTDDQPGAIYAISGGKKYMVVLPAAAYDARVASYWFREPSGYTETTADMAAQDGLEVVHVRSVPENEGEPHLESYYYVAPKTGLIFAMAIETYAPDGTLTSTSKTTVNYDTANVIGEDISAQMLGTGNDCALTLTIDPESGTPEVQNFNIARDVNVTFVGGGYTLYSDAELGTEIDGMNIDVNRESAVIFAAKAAE